MPGGEAAARRCYTAAMPRDLSRRSDDPEVMDDSDFPLADYRRCLADLGRINRLTLTHRPILRWLDGMTDGWEPGRELRLLDVAYGGGDLLRAIHVWATRRGLAPVLSGVDLNPRAAGVAAEATPPGMDIAWHSGDVFHYVPIPPPDFIVCSQFLHHLSTPQAAFLLGWLSRHARRGWFVLDVHRHWLPYRGFPLLARLLGWHKVIREDGAISAARGFSAREWRTLARGAGAAARWELPFRWSAAFMPPPS